MFTFERFLSILTFAVYSFDEGKSSVPAEPSMPGIFDNFFVFSFLIIGIIFVLVSFSDKVHQ
ncbi:hypothetical protein [Paraliobacillus sp. JSM ZJ581]|uniref:hypothetical protein n=1 Tax=Paraliobacillus sp. JSM ZJ581 TaxID=3342118 RepID=UPI0035A96090